jgi:serine/threonine protein phosphatase 1
MSRTFVLGDVHGAYHALRQCIDRSGFDPANDTLIFLGDVCDGWPQTRECIDYLMGVPNLICLLGNHDFWFNNWMQYGEAEDIWLEQGGQATVDSYKDGVPKSHLMFVGQAKTFYEKDNRLFVHAGIPPGMRPEECSQHQLLWDRTLPMLARTLGTESKLTLTQYNEVFIGHTPIESPHPVKYCEVWMMDTGAGWSGVLSMMNLDTKECFMSDPVPTLYPGIAGRKKSRG